MINIYKHFGSLCNQIIQVDARKIVSYGTTEQTTRGHIVFKPDCCLTRHIRGFNWVTKLSSIDLNFYFFIK